jgi:hypothetical protein
MGLLSRYAKIDEAAVQACAQRYLKAGLRNVVSLLPTEQGKI